VSRQIQKIKKTGQDEKSGMEQGKQDEQDTKEFGVANCKHFC